MHILNHIATVQMTFFFIQKIIVSPPHPQIQFHISPTLGKTCSPFCARHIRINSMDVKFIQTNKMGAYQM